MTNTQTAMPASNSFAALTGRVKRINPEELYAVAQAIVEQENATLAALGSQQQAAVGAQQQQSAAATGAAALGPIPIPTADTPVSDPDDEPAFTQAPVTATAAATTETAAARTQTAAVTETAATTNSGAVAIPSSNVAPRTQHDYWTKHIAQFAGKYLPDGPSMRPNCGPASVTMALRMVGLDIPGFNGQNSGAVLDKARILATGKNDVSVGTTDSELETLISKSGAKWSESTNFNEVTDWVKQGIPVVLSGNPAYGWNHRYTSDQVYPFNGGHWVTVSGYDPATGHYIVNDPLSQVGPIYVSEAELKSYNQSHGNLGIAVFR
jgi:hypothetical protein